MKKLLVLSLVTILAGCSFDQEAVNIKQTRYYKSILPKGSSVISYSNRGSADWITFEYNGQCILMLDGYSRNSMVKLDNEICKGNENEY
jgi:hypothetical protein